jgi:surface polysaccharide O-acyltransferase-like enzyme
MGTAMLNLLIAPKQSEATFLWYIYLLFIFYCIAPLLFNAKRWVRGVVFVVALLLSTHYIAVPYLCIDWFTRYFVFFLVGAWAAEHYDQLEQIDVRWSLLALIAFIAMSVCHFVGGYNAPLEYAMQLMGIPAFVGVAWLLKQVTVVRKALVYVSVNCFGVYLLHMFFVQAGAMIMARLPWAIPAWGYVIYLLISTAVSIGATAWGYNAVNSFAVRKR